MTTTFTTQQVDNAIRAGLRGGRTNFSLTPNEAADKSAAYEGNLAHYQGLVEKCLAEGDYRQAAEKSWGAYAQTIKVIAAAHGMNVANHRSLLRVASALNILAGSADPAIYTRLRMGYLSAQALHQQFYENHMPDGDVISSAADVRDAINLLHTLL